MSEFNDIVFTPNWNPLDRTLVEASAGTGKTYNIQNVYLRLVLEGKKVQEILVVTFTEAATRELRDRLRAVLTLTRDFLGPRGLEPNDQNLSRIRAAFGLGPEQTAADLPEERRVGFYKTVRLALMDFDSAAIFTIHGFCNRVLERHAFECGHDPDAELLPDDSRIVLEACRDWWRLNTYVENQARTVPFEDFDSLVALVQQVAQHPDAELKPHEFDRHSLARLQTALDNVQLRDDLELNAQAGELVQQLVAAKQAFQGGEPDLQQLDGTLSIIGKSAEKARWTQTAILPPCVHRLIEECQKLTGSSSGRGNKQWLPEDQIQWGNAVWNPKDVLGLLGDLQHDIAEWLQSGVRLKESSKPTLLMDLINQNRQLAAEDFIKAVQAVAKIEKDSEVIRESLELEDLSPGLPKAVAEAHESLFSRQAVIAKEMAATIRTRIRDRSALTYDAMLFNVREVLRTAEAGDRLKDVLRAEYKAALIDEFQDTDSIQYEIFDLIFAPEAGAPLVLVGDPKQAIYGFRSGDVFTYYAAKAGTVEHSLGTNFRSETNLVHAVNELFKDGPTPTFINQNIQYSGNLRPHSMGADKELLLPNGQRDPQPMKLWIYTPDEHETLGDEGLLARRIYADVAKEIVRIRKDEKPLIGGRPLEFKDIAVLVRTHREAAAIQRELIRRGVNAVRQSTGNVFETEEALQLALVMQAMESPGRAANIRAALSVPFMPCDPATVAAFNRDELPRFSEAPPEDAAIDEGSPIIPKMLEDWIEVFRAAGDRWRTRSFIEAFQFLTKRLGVRAHLLAQPDGTRRLTDLLHLAELAHQAARVQQLAPLPLLRWFTRQLEDERRDEDNEGESSKTRLDDDNDAVTIMTVFKSKGLQFPVVFVPTLWRHKAQAKHRDEPAFKYHDSNKQLVLDLDSCSEAAKDAANGENLQENIRLAYVGLTRAINRVYLFAVPKSKSDNCAINHILRHCNSNDSEPGAPQAMGSILYCNPPPQLDEGEWLDLEATGAVSDAPPLPPLVDKAHGHASYSSLAPHGSSKTLGEPSKDREQGENTSPTTPDGAEPTDAIFTIYGGAKLGTCWHEIFEFADFEKNKTALGQQELDQWVGETLDRHRICSKPAPDMPTDKQALMTARRQAVLSMVRNVLSTPLDSGCGSFRLQDISLSARRSELEFQFSLKDDSCHCVGNLADIVAKYWTEDAPKKSFIDSLRTKTAQIPRGFMTGFIDLVFQHDNKFYIVDWKSNRLNGNASDFHPAGLGREMAEHAYYLQYLIYTVAVHGYLSRHLVDYDYDNHFGGVFYLFLRGMDGSSQRGVFTDRPPKALIESLSEFLGGCRS